MNSSLPSIKNIDHNNELSPSRKKSKFKAIGLYVKIGRRLTKTVELKRYERELSENSLFEQVLTSHENRSDAMLKKIEEDAIPKNANVPRMSGEMRKILLELDKSHLVDERDSIAEEPNIDLSTSEERESELSVTEQLKRPKWNNFVIKKIIPKQRFLATFSTEIASRKEQTDMEKQAERQAIKMRLATELKLPKVSKTTEDLMIRKKSLDNKLRIMRVCHENGVQYNHSFTNTSNLSRCSPPRTAPTNRHRNPSRSNSCHPILFPPRTYRMRSATK